MMHTAIMAISLALVFYTLAIATEQFSGLKKSILLVFGAGLSCDILGTTLMSLKTKGIIFNNHTVLGIVSLFVMTTHFIWAIKAIRGNVQSQKFFTRFSPFAWLAWLFAFLSGIP